MTAVLEEKLCASCNGSKKVRLLSDWRYRVLNLRKGVIAQ